MRQASRQHRRRPRRRAGRPRPRRPGRRGCGSCAAPGTSCACCSWSSCTTHSTSDRPPRPSLVCRRRVGAARQPLGLHPGLEPADLADGVARRCRPRASAPGRSARGTARRSPSSPTSGVGAQQRLRLPRRGPARVVGARTTRACGPAAPAGPRAAGPASMSSGGSGAGSASSRRSSSATACAARRRLALVGAGQRVVHEHARRRRCRSRARARRTGPSRRRRTGSAAARRRSHLDLADGGRAARPRSWRRRCR